MAFSGWATSSLSRSLHLALAIALALRSSITQSLVNTRKQWPTYLTSGSCTSRRSTIALLATLTWDLCVWPPNFPEPLSSWMATVMRRREQLGEPLRRALMSLGERLAADATTQDEIDAIFTSCDSAEDWADAGMAATVKTLAEACGCGGARPAAAAPALALALGLAAALLA